MSQRFRRNIAPVLGALLLMALGIGAWALLGVQRTEESTAALHARFQVAEAPWNVAPPEDGYAVFDYRRDGERCVVVSLLPDTATLLVEGAAPRTVARAAAEALVDETARLAADCNRLEVRVFATRIPWNGRFVVQYEGGRVLKVGDPAFDD